MHGTPGSRPGTSAVACVGRSDPGRSTVTTGVGTRQRSHGRLVARTDRFDREWLTQPMSSAAIPAHWEADVLLRDGRPPGCGRSGPTTPTGWSSSTRGSRRVEVPALLRALPDAVRPRRRAVHPRRLPRPGGVRGDRRATRSSRSAATTGSTTHAGRGRLPRRGRPPGPRAGAAAAGAPGPGRRASAASASSSPRCCRTTAG